MENDPFILTRRMRRMRRNPAVRALVQETRVQVDDLIAPVFVKSPGGEREPVASMPGVFRYPLDQLVETCKLWMADGIRAVALFPVIPPELKDHEGTQALNPDNLTLTSIRTLRKALPDLVIIMDVALDPYTSHGHDGIPDSDGWVDNDRTLDSLTKLAVLQAQAGADWVAPSDMMDGRVAAIRRALDKNHLTNTGILAYSAKFNSAYYGPFRDAIGSKKAAGSTYLDKGQYQLNPANPREALLDARLDEEEGADMLMVKPGGAYLDIICRLRQQSCLPLAAYQVSGEYSQIHAAAQLGWLDYKSTRDESLLALKRAGADLILTYFAPEIAAEYRKA